MAKGRLYSKSNFLFYIKLVQETWKSIAIDTATSSWNKNAGKPREIKSYGICWQHVAKLQKDGLKKKKKINRRFSMQNFLGNLTFFLQWIYWTVG